MVKELRERKSNTIELQFKNGRYFAHGDSGWEILQRFHTEEEFETELNCTSFSQRQSDRIFPRLVRDGFKIKITEL